jgi:hypothetical protein
LGADEERYQRRRRMPLLRPDQPSRRDERCSGHRAQERSEDGVHRHGEHPDGEGLVETDSGVGEGLDDSIDRRRRTPQRGAEQEDRSGTDTDDLVAFSHLR